MVAGSASRLVGRAGRLGRRPAGPGRTAAGRMARRRDGSTTVKSGPHRIVYRVELPEGAHLHQAFPGPEPAGDAPPVGPPRQGAERGEALAAPGHDRRADDHADRAGRTAEAEVPVRELSGHPAISDAIPLDEFVEQQLPEWPEPRRSRIRQKLAEALAVMTARLHDAGLPAPGLSSRQHPGSLRDRRTSPSSS